MALDSRWWVASVFGFTIHRRVKNLTCSSDIGVLSIAYHSVRMARRWRVEVLTLSSVYGMLELADSSEYSPGIRMISRACRSVRMARRWRVEVLTLLIRLWNVRTGRLLRILTGHRGIVYSVSFSPDGKTLASGGFDATIRLWDVRTGGLLRTLEGHTKGWISSVSFSPDGTDAGKWG